jgi:hypothetical protein
MEHAAVPNSVKVNIGFIRVRVRTPYIRGDVLRVTGVPRSYQGGSPRPVDDLVGEDRGPPKGGARLY